MSSTVRRKILAYLSHAELSAGDIASRFAMSKPSISQHLSILEAAGLVISEKRGQFVFYKLVPESLANTLNGFVQEVCPVSRPLKRESATLAKRERRRRNFLMIQHHLIVTGRVQNVFYRDWLKEQADALGLDGWARNRADGSVEAVKQDPREMVETIIARAREGSPASRVADVIVSEVESAILNGFEKRPTA